jgi:hypothetical protein
MDAPVAVELAWDPSSARQGCIDRDELATRVEATLGHRVFARLGADGVGATVQGYAAADPPGHGWIAVVEVQRKEAPPLRRELRLRAADCHQLDDAIVLVVALMVDVSGGGSSALPLDIGSTSHRVSVSVGPDLAIAVGMLPGAAIGIGLVTQMEIQPLWPIAVWAHGWPLNSAFDNSTGAKGQMWALTFGAAVCPWKFTANRWQLLACAGGSAGTISAQGLRPLSPANSDTEAYVQAEAEAAVRFRIASPISIRLGLGAAVPFTQNRYTYTLSPAGQSSPPPVFQTWVVVPFGHVSVEIPSPD